VFSVAYAVSHPFLLIPMLQFSDPEMSGSNLGEGKGDLKPSLAQSAASVFDALKSKPICTRTTARHTPMLDLEIATHSQILADQREFDATTQG
jgi:hypothetical protein